MINRRIRAIGADLSISNIKVGIVVSVLDAELLSAVVPSNPIVTFSDLPRGAETTK